jgi:flagellar biosynthesis/type III secretory pathway protein FliH
VGREVAQCQKCKYAFAALIFNKESDREWLRRKFTMDILEESWAYQEMVQKGLQQGLEKGLEKGLKKGRQEGELQAQRETLLDIVQARFPELVILAKKQMSNIKDPQILRHLTVKISTVQTANEVEQLLLALTKDQKKH